MELIISVMNYANFKAVDYVPKINRKQSSQPFENIISKCICLGENLQIKVKMSLVYVTVV